MRTKQLFFNLFKTVIRHYSLYYLSYFVQLLFSMFFALCQILWLMDCCYEEPLELFYWLVQKNQFKLINWSMMTLYNRSYNVFFSFFLQFIKVKDNSYITTETLENRFRFETFNDHYAKNKHYTTFVIFGNLGRCEMNKVS